MLLEYEISIVQIGRLSTNLGILSQYFPSFYTRDHIPLEARVQPSIADDDHILSLHKGKLWRSPQHM